MCDTLKAQKILAHFSTLPGPRLEVFRDPSPLGFSAQALAVRCAPFMFCLCALARAMLFIAAISSPQ